MEKKFFEINENSARVSHDMMSMRDYKQGSTTVEYQGMALKAYELADKVATMRPEEADRVYRLAERYSKKLADYYNRESSIGMMCPSVMIAGPANFPVKKKERQIAAWNKNHEYFEYIQGILRKIEAILYGKNIIKSNDERAIEKLEEKLQDLKDTQELMKTANKALRIKEIETGNDVLRELGFSEEKIKKLREPDYCGRIGYPSFELTNNNANIRRIEERIKSLKAAKERGTSEREYQTFKVVENTEIMRYQIIFEGKPEADVRDVLKGNGFKWSPSQSAWQRQITANGKWALNRTLEKLQEMEKNSDC